MGEALSPQPLTKPVDIEAHVLRELRAMGVSMIVFFDENDGLLAIEYPAEKLTNEQAAAVMAHVLRDTLGDEPTMADIVTIQRTMMAAMG